MEKINVEKLNELGIFEIRNLAREVGVYSPTTLKKQELIEKILRIMEGQDEPYIKKTKQGRPPKNLTSINNLVDVIVPSKIFENKKTITANKTFFCDLNESLNVNVIGTNETNFKSLVKVYNNGEYALAFLNEYKEDIEKVVFITNLQLEFYKLKTGDEITGKYTFVTQDKPFILKEIYSINGNNFTESFKRNDDFAFLPALPPCQKLKLSIYKINEEIYNNLDLIAPLAKGQRVLLHSYSFNNSLNYQILNRLTTSVNDLKGLAILIDEMPENYYALKNNNRMETLSNNYCQNSNFRLELDIKLERLKRQVENGEEVVLFINDLDKLNGYLINLYILENNNKDNAKIFAEEYIKNLILLGKYSINNGSLTVVCGLLNSQNNNFLNLFNNIVCYKKVGFEFKLDINNCSTYNIENILTKTELTKLMQLNK